MEINHRISFNGDVHVAFYTEVKRLNLKHIISPLPGHDVGLVTFEITESNPGWGEIRELVELFDPLDLVGTSFSPEEIINSEWNRLVPMHEWGYPQPKSQMEWVQLTYENECPTCGAGYSQKAPFQIQKDPKLGKYSFFTLFWTYTLFCKRNVVNTLQNSGINGFEVWSANLQTTNQPSTLISQLTFPVITASGLANEDKKNPEACSECGIVKYSHHRRGIMHFQRRALREGIDFQLTHEWFGSGSRSGFREIIVSNRISRLILSEGWKGIELKPIATI